MVTCCMEINRSRKPQTKQMPQHRPQIAKNRRMIALPPPRRAHGCQSRKNAPALAIPPPQTTPQTAPQSSTSTSTQTACAGILPSILQKCTCKVTSTTNSSPNSTPEQHLHQHPNCTPHPAINLASQEARAPFAVSYPGERVSDSSPHEGPPK